MQFYAKLLSKTPTIIYRPSQENQRSEELTRVIDLTFEVSKTRGFKSIKRVFAIDEVQLMVKKGSSDGIERLWTVKRAGQGILGLAITEINYSMKPSGRSQRIRNHFQGRRPAKYLRSRNQTIMQNYSPFSRHQRIATGFMP